MKWGDQMSLRDDLDLATRIDLLVDGELPEESRRALLLGLDSEPQGWRRCALAFLEAQGWRQAFGEVSRELPILVAQRPAARFRFRPWLASAAGVVAAFGMGLMIRPSPTTPSTAGANPPPKAVASNRPVPPSPLPVGNRPTPSIARGEHPRPAPVDYARGRLEREGYRVEQTRMLLPGTTRDGRRVAVPVRRTTVRFVGNRSV